MHHAAVATIALSYRCTLLISLSRERRLSSSQLLLLAAAQRATTKDAAEACAGPSQMKPLIGAAEIFRSCLLHRRLGAYRNRLTRNSFDRWRSKLLRVPERHSFDQGLCVKAGQDGFAQFAAQLQLHATVISSACSTECTGDRAHNIWRKIYRKEVMLSSRCD